MAKRLKNSCPNCDETWGIEEISFQECDSCGYPRQEDCNQPDREDYDYGMDEDEYYSDGYIPE